MYTISFSCLTQSCNWWVFVMKIHQWQLFQYGIDWHGKCEFIVKQFCSPQCVWNSGQSGCWNGWVTSPWQLDRCYFYTHFMFSFVASFAHSSFVAYWKDIARIIVMNSWYDSCVFIAKNNNNNNLLRIRKLWWLLFSLMIL